MASIPQPRYPGPEQGREQAGQNDVAIQLLRSWRDGDEDEQRETWEFLRQALDEDRLSQRKLCL